MGRKLLDILIAFILGGIFLGLSYIVAPALSTIFLIAVMVFVISIVLYFIFKKGSVARRVTKITGIAGGTCSLLMAAMVVSMLSTM